MPKVDQHGEQLIASVHILSWDLNLASKCAEQMKQKEEDRKRLQNFRTFLALLAEIRNQSLMPSTIHEKRQAKLQSWHSVNTL